MATRHVTRFTSISPRADIMALDAAGKPVLIAEVKLGHLVQGASKEQLARYLDASDVKVPFAMLVTETNIEIFQWDGQHLSAPIFKADTAGILNAYDPEFSQKDIFEYYMVTLVEAWLRDIAYHWKSDVPPGYLSLEKVGVAQQLEGGTTRTQASLTP
jgi:hypothetical protein